jgi:predicted nucleotidyltransferase
MNTSIHNTIHNTLREIPAIKLAIVFGSVTGNRETANSDIDLAILMDTRIDAIQKIKIIEALASATGRPIDLIDLRDAGQPLPGEILTNGKRIVGNDVLYAQLITKNLFDRADFIPYRNRILEEKRHACTGK